MPRSEAERVRDILDAIAAIRADTDGLDHEGCAARPTVARSVLYSIGVIGEAVKGLGPAFRSARPGVP